MTLEERFDLMIAGAQETHDDELNLVSCPNCRQALFEQFSSAIREAKREAYEEVEQLEVTTSEDGDIPYRNGYHDAVSDYRAKIRALKDSLVAEVASSA